MHSAHQTERSRAFTLIELLAVIAIIGTLASLTLTVLAKARGKARAGQCTQNLKQFGLGLATFVQNNHVYPFHITPINQRPRYREHRGFWGRAIIDGSPGIRTDEPGLFNCPSASKPSSPEWLPGDGFSDYGYNAHGQVGPNGEGNLGLGGAGASDGSEVRPVPEADVLGPASMFAIGEGVIGNKDALNEGLIIFSRTAELLRRSNAESRVLRRHDGRLQTLFCDGHIESRPVTELFKSEASADLAAWNRDNLAHPERLR